MRWSWSPESRRRLSACTSSQRRSSRARIASSWRSSSWLRSGGIAADLSQGGQGVRDGSLALEALEEAFAGALAGFDGLDVPGRPELGQGDACERLRRVGEDADARPRANERAQRGARLGARAQIDGRPVLGEALECAAPVADARLRPAVELRGRRGTVLG